MHRMLSLFAAILICTIIGYAQGTVYDIRTTTTNWQSILGSLQAGDTAIIHQGTYTTAGSGYFQLTLNGLLTKPIIIQGAQGEARPIIQCAQAGANAQNTINIQGSNFVIKGVAFTKGARGVRLGPAGTFLLFCIYTDMIISSFLVTWNAIFDNIYIYNTTGTAFSANDAGIEYSNITLRNSEITNTNALSKYKMVGTSLI